MPTATERTVEGYASCTDGRCPGYKQERVELIETETAYSFVDLGGDIPGIERSTVMFRFVNEDDIPCHVCGEPRLCDAQLRPIYPNISGIPQDAILQIGAQGQRVRDMELENARRDAATAQMAALVERQTAALERQEKQIEALTSDLASRP